jgi:hypothetical protein
MTRRKGEITRADLKRNWPHHVVLRPNIASRPLSDVEEEQRA